jgi:hypothetical protein
VTSIFTTQAGLFLRNPHGGIENIAAMRTAGFQWVAANIGDHTPSEWDTVRERAKLAAVTCLPWARTATSSNTFDPTVIDRLTACADQWGTPLIINSESEIKGSGYTATKLIASKVGNRDAAISMEAWPFANVHWTPVAHLPVLPQIFPAVANIDPTDAKAEWHAYGIKCVVFTYGAFTGMTPNSYDLKHPYSVYTADDMNGNYAAWSATSYGYQGCIDEPPPPAPVVDIAANRRHALADLKASVDYYRSSGRLTEEGISINRQALAWRVLNTSQSGGNMRALRDTLDEAGAPKP